MADHQFLQEQTNSSDEPDDVFGSIDLEKVVSILKKSLLYIVVIFLLCNLSTFLYVRYTKPIYESESVLKLDIQSESSLVGVQNPLENATINGLSGEIELLKSNLFFGKVADAVGMDVSYYYYGRYLTDERYNNHPFVVSHKALNEQIYDRRIDLEILSDQEFILDYDWNGDRITGKYGFGEEIATEHFNLLVHKTSSYSEDNGIGKYYFTLNSREALINYFKENVTVQPLNFNAKTITVSLQDFNKNKARDLVQAIDTLYLAYTKEAKNLAIEQKINFVQSQLEQTEGKLEGFEDFFENFTIENRTVNVAQDVAEAINQLEKYDSIRFRLRNSLKSIDLVTQKMKNGGLLLLSPVTYNFLPDYIVSGLEEFKSKQLEREKLLGAYNENTYVVQRLDVEMDAISENVILLVESYRENLQESTEDINNRIVKIEQIFAGLPSMGNEYNKQRRFYNLQENFYISLMQSKTELEIARAGTVTNFVILSPASLPAEPIHPKSLLIYGIGLAVSFILSFFFLAARYLLNSEISGQSEFEKLINIPLLGAVPTYKQERRNGNAQLVVDQNAKSGIAESLRSIRTNMDFMNVGNGVRVISITSTVSGEGKTFITVNLSAIFANSKNRVLILDMDMRKAKVHAAFGDDIGEIGLSTLLINKHKYQEAIRSTKIQNLSYIPAGPIPPNPSELLISGNFDKLLAELKKEYDYIVMDTPPVGLVTDGMLVMNKADLPIYVVRANYSKRAFIKSLKKLRQMNQFKHLSVILNGVSPTQNYGYGHGYGSGYYE